MLRMYSMKVVSDATRTVPNLQWFSPPLASQEMIDEADRDGDGEINEEEFLRIMKKTNLY